MPEPRKFGRGSACGAGKIHNARRTWAKNEEEAENSQSIASLSQK
jgi:hypothetical protein